MSKTHPFEDVSEKKKRIKLVDPFMNAKNMLDALCCFLACADPSALQIRFLIRNIYSNFLWLDTIL